MLRFKSSCPVLAALLLALSRGADGFAVPVRMSSRSQTSLRAGEASAAPVQSSAEGHTEELPQALIFDCDGVLADTERDGHRPAFNAAFKIKNLGACLDHDDVMRDQNIKRSTTTAGPADLSRVQEYKSVTRCIFLCGGSVRK